MAICTRSTITLGKKGQLLPMTPVRRTVQYATMAIVIGFQSIHSVNRDGSSRDVCVCV